MKPVIALVGRPNVGKSTLFNRLTRSRDALVANMPGLTRDRHYGEGRLGGRPYLLIDTGGFESNAEEGITQHMARQMQQAVQESDLVIFVVDVRQGNTTQDALLADYLRKTGRPIMVVVNKAEGFQTEVANVDFYAFGLGTPYPISASHGEGVAVMIDEALSRVYPENEPIEESKEDSARGTKIAIVGRPNVGKSTLVNTLLGEERVIAFDMPGTTRDSIYIDFTRQGRPYTLIDTAGLRRRGKVFEAVEKFSVVKTLQSISDANVVIFLLDARQDITEQDAHIASFIVEQGRALVVAVNKWDKLDSYTRERIKADLGRKVEFLNFAQFHFISATEKTGIGPLMRSVDDAFIAAMAKLPTPKLTRILLEAVQAQPPRRHGLTRPKPRYAHQGGQNPPIVVIHGSALDAITPAYQRYLERKFRETFSLIGTPLRIEFRTKLNPYKNTE